LSTVPCTWQELRVAYKERFQEMPEPVPPVQVRQPGIRFTTVDQNSVEVQVSVESQADALRHKQQQEAQQPMTQKGPQRKVLVEKEHFDAAFHGQCWTLREGWWTYEWCYDKWVRQFHEDKGIFLSEYLLGLGLKALEVDAIGKRKVQYADGYRSLLQKLERQPDPKANGMVYYVPPTASVPPHYSTWYYDGTDCDGKERSVEVQMFCTTVQEPAVSFKIVEPRTCVYTLVVNSHLVCNLPQPMEQT